MVFTVTRKCNGADLSSSRKRRRDSAVATVCVCFGICDGLVSVFPERCECTDGRIVFSSTAGDWQLIGLDSQITGDVAGQLGSAQLEWLDGQLQECDRKHVIVFVHHPPVPVRCEKLDAIGLGDAQQLLDLLRSDNRVRLICCGHVHQASTTSLDGLTVMTTPAIGPQFRPRSTETQSDLLPAAARLIELESDGCWSSQVIRVPCPTEEIQ